MEEQEREKKSNVPVLVLSLETRNANQVKTMTQEAVREENQKLNEMRSHRDKVWSMLANQVMGSEHIRE